MFRQDLTSMEIFQEFNQEQLALIDSSLDMIDFEAEASIFRQDQSADYLYILLDGDVEICYKPYDGPKLTVTSLQPGGVFGWSAAMGKPVYTSSAEARTACRVYRMTTGQIREIYTASPETGKLFLRRLAGVIARRVSNTHDQVLAIISQGMHLENTSIMEDK